MKVFYTKEHEYIKLEGEIGTIGITNYAQHQLGDVVFVELPEIGKKIKKGTEIAVVESVKAASDVYSPVSGEIIEINSSIADNPSLINEDAENGAWFFKIKISNKEEIQDLMDQSAYKAFIGE